jgi:tRNA(Ile)-lysidine synthase
MKKIDEKIIRFIQNHNLISTGDKILIGLSGGPDSVFILNFLLKYKRKYKIEIGAMHINHMIRGKEADADEDFCKNLCLRSVIRFHSVKRNVPSFAKHNKISTEEAAREIRYEELERCRKEFGYDKIATGHTCSDNAETVLLNMIKGAGIKGLSGIPINRGNIIRPILSIGKDEILEYLAKNKIEFLIDKTNLSNVYERNIIRNELFPLIKKYLNPKIEQTLFKSSSVLKSQSILVQSAIRLISETIVSKKDEQVELSISELKKIDQNLWSELIKYTIDKNFQLQSSFADCLKIASLVSKQTGKNINILNNIVALKERDKILIYRKGDHKKRESVEGKVGKTIKIGQKKIKLEIVDKNSIRYSTDKNIEYISADKISDRFILREWKAGDKFYPLGTKGSKNVSDFLNDKKVSSFEKNRQLVLLNDNRIIWVVGYQIDNRFKITDQTKKVLKLWLI